MLAVDAGPVAGATVALGAEVTAECGVGTAVGAGSAGSAPGGAVGAALTDGDEAVRTSEVATFVVAGATDARSRIATASDAARETAASGPLSLKRFSTSQFSQRAWSLAETLRQIRTGHISPVRTGGPAPTGEALARRPRVRRSYAAIRASAGCRGNHARSLRHGARSDSDLVPVLDRRGAAAGVSGRRGGERVGQPAGADRRGQNGKAATQHDRGRECR